MDYREEVQEIQTQVRFLKNRLAGLTLEMEEDGKDTGNLDEALEALDDAIDTLADW
jgi:archaellum component FlaC